MTQNYPYYIPVQMDGGILRKLFSNKKFKTHNDAVEAMTNKYKSLAEITNQNLFLTTQNAILEYTQEYQGRIVSLYTDGEYTFVSIPKILM